MAADNKEAKESSFARQVGVCLSRCRRAFINENGWKLIVSVGLIMLLISTVTGEDLFVTDKATRNGCFALICACIWTGIFNSIRSVCKERDIIKREHRTGLRMSSYVVAHVIHEGMLSMVEAFVAAIIIWRDLTFGPGAVDLLFPDHFRVGYFRDDDLFCCDK